MGKFLLDKITVTVKRHRNLSPSLDKHWKKTLTWALTSAQHAKQDVQRYINRLEAFKHRPNSEEAEGSLHGKHNPLSEMPFAGEEMLSSEKGHKRDRNALSEMPFAGETSLSSEHHHKRNRNALTEMPFAGEESLSSENVHKRNRNSLTEMPFANEESLSTEVSGKIRKNRHGKRKQSSSSSSSSSSEEHGGKKKRGRSEHMDPGKYLKTVFFKKRKLSKN